MANKGLDNYSVRPMKPEEVEDVFDIIDKEGWKLTLDKFHMVYEAYPQKFYVAVTNDGELCGTMSLYPTFDGEYVLGNIVVKENHRKKGLGRKLVSDILADNPGAIVSLTAVPGADQFYLNIGFHFTQPQQGHSIFHMTVDLNALESNLKELDKDIIIASYDEKSFNDLVAYDHEARGYLNTSYIAMQVKCFTVITAKSVQGKMLGFGAAFLKNNEIISDGLYADSDAIALRLIIGILETFPGKNKVKFQVPSSNLYLSTLGKIESSYEFNRYSIGPRPPTQAPLSKVYNVGDCDYTY